MLQKENLKDGVITGIILSLIIGIIISWILKPSFVSIILILSLALLPGFFLMTLLYLYRLSNEKISKSSIAERFEWGVEVNLRRLQILHTKYSSLIQTTGLLAMASFLGMIYLAAQFPKWTTGHMIFFPISTALFIFSLHLIFRWWFTMRTYLKYLMFTKSKS